MVEYYLNIVTVPLLIALFIYHLCEFLDIYSVSGDESKDNRYIEAHRALEAQYFNGIELMPGDQREISIATYNKTSPLN